MTIITSPLKIDLSVKTLCNLHTKRLNHAMVPCSNNNFRQPCCQLCSALDYKTATFQPITTAAERTGRPQSITDFYISTRHGFDGSAEESEGSKG